MEGEQTTSATLLNVKPGTIIAGRYQVECRIGSGGMGMVFRVIDRDLNNQIVALKLLHPHLAEDEQVFRRFRNEVLVARSLSHPHIVRIHDIGRAEGGFSYISMEYVDGLSLRDYINSKTSQGGGPASLGKTLPYDESLTIFSQVLSGIAYAHEKGVIHRDMKPANVMISNSREIKLADFGTARIAGMDTHLTQTGQSIGTPDYMSPEQIQGQQLDARCDVYALGIVAYELVTGDRPFVADSAVAVAFKHLHEPLPELIGDAANVPDWYKHLIRKATAKDKNERFANAGEIIMLMAEHMPELAVQTGRYSVDRTHSMSSSNNPAIKKNSAAVTQEAKFELGDTGQEQSSGIWQVGDIEKMDLRRDRMIDDSRVRRVVHADDEKSNFGKLVVAAFALCLAILTILPRVSDGVNSWLGESIRGTQSDLGISLSWLASITGVSIEEPILTELAKQSDTSLTQTSETAVASGSTSPSQNSQTPNSTQSKTATAASDAKTSPKQVTAAETTNTTQNSKTESKAEQAPKASASVTDVAKNEKKTEVEVEQTATKVTEDPKTKATESSKESEESAALELAGGTAASAVESGDSEAVVDDPEASNKKSETASAVVPPVAVKNIEAKLFLKGSDGTEINAPVNVSELRNIKWSADIDGLGELTSAAEQQLNSEFSLNLVSLKQFNLIAKIPAASLRSTPGGEVAMDGNFQKLAAKSPDAGAYRLDLVRKGEVLASKELSLYSVSSAPVATTQPSLVGNAGEKIKIVRGSDGTGSQVALNSDGSYSSGQIAGELPRFPSAALAGGNVAGANGTTPPAAGMPTSSGYPAMGTAPMNTPPAPSFNIPAQNSYGVGNSGLPAARQPNSTTASAGTATLPQGYNKSSLDLSKEQFQAGANSYAMQQSQQQPRIGAAEHYTGTIFIAAPGSASAEERAMTLDLNVQGSSIAGQARVDGLGQFNVNGQIHPRGLELELNAASGEQIRLTGSKRGRSLRGTYVLRGDSRHGRWQANLIQ